MDQSIHSISAIYAGGTHCQGESSVHNTHRVFHFKTMKRGRLPQPGTKLEGTCLAAWVSVIWTL